MNNNWRGLVKILEIQHIRNGKVIWEEHNLRNLLHTTGEAFILRCAFINNGAIVPANYYFGLDARPTIALADTMADILDEPSGNGYVRQQVSSNGGFSLTVVGGVNRAVSSILTFTSTGAGYGPVKNLFLTDQSGAGGTLISSNPLSSPITLAGGDSVNLRLSLQLSDVS